MICTQNADMNSPNPLVHTLDHPLAHRALAQLRSKHTSTDRFRQQVKELARYLLLEATRDLPLVSATVETPLGTAPAQILVDQQIVVASILRAGLAMVEPAMQLLPEAEIRHIGLARDEKTLQPVSYYLKLPDSYAPETLVLILDPMLATGGSASAAIDLFKTRGVKKIKFLGLIASPEGVARVTSDHPDVEIYVVSIDERLNDKGYIVPGLGDAGDRMFGT
jgi:uracil phosphoribosyltransferase